MISPRQAALPTLALPFPQTHNDPGNPLTHNHCCYRSLIDLQVVVYFNQINIFGFIFLNKLFEKLLVDIFMNGQFGKFCMDLFSRFDLILSALS